MDFFRDFCAMVETVGRKVGGLLELTSRETTIRRYSGNRLAIAFLTPLAGVHRAQLVDVGGTSGRIVTEKLSLVVGDVESSLVRRTYSYAASLVTDHVTGATFSLAEALGGHTGDPPPNVG